MRPETVIVDPAAPHIVIPAPLDAAFGKDVALCLYSLGEAAPYYDDDPRKTKWCDCSACREALTASRAEPGHTDLMVAPEDIPADLGIGDPLVDPTAALALPDADEERGQFPMADGLLDYFPNALAYVSWVSKIGNDQHNPGEPMHWARDKSLDHANKVMRHLVDRGRFDGRGVRHTGRAAWRILAMLQTELEDAGICPPSRASRNHPAQLKTI